MIVTGKKSIPTLAQLNSDHIYTAPNASQWAIELSKRPYDELRRLQYTVQNTMSGLRRKATPADWRDSNSPISIRLGNFYLMEQAIMHAIAEQYKSTKITVDEFHAEGRRMNPGKTVAGVMGQLLSRQTVRLKTPGGIVEIKPLTKIGDRNESVGMGPSGPLYFGVFRPGSRREMAWFGRSGIQNYVAGVVGDSDFYRSSKGRNKASKALTLSDEPRPVRTDIRVGDYIRSEFPRLIARVIAVGGLKYGKKWIGGYRAKIIPGGRTDFFAEDDVTKIPPPAPGHDFF